MKAVQQFILQAATFDVVHARYHNGLAEIWGLQQHLKLYVQVESLSSNKMLPSPDYTSDLNRQLTVDTQWSAKVGIIMLAFTIMERKLR